MNKVFFGDCRDSMREMIAQGIKAQMCVTSPPYFGLRDYNHPGQLGLESTPAEYVANMVEVFRLVRDVLSDDGVLWLNLGDSYAANRTYQVHNTKGAADHTYSPGSKVPDGLKPKDLPGIVHSAQYGTPATSAAFGQLPPPHTAALTSPPSRLH